MQPFISQNHWIPHSSLVILPFSSLVSPEIDDFSQFFPSQTQSIASANAKHCNRPRKALHVPTQSFASALAKHCVKRGLSNRQKKKSYIAVTLYHFKWCHQESNRGHKDFQSFALPTELWHHHIFLPYMTGAAAPSSVKASAKVVFFICSRKFF